MLWTRARKLYCNSIYKCQVICLYFNCPLVVNKTSRQEERTCWGEENDFLWLLDHIGKTAKDVRQHMLITMATSQSDPLITQWWGAGTDKITEIYLHPSLKGSSILPSLHISSCFPAINIFLAALSVSSNCSASTLACLFCPRVLLIYSSISPRSIFKQVALF